MSKVDMRHDVISKYVCAHMATSHKPSPYTCCICTFYIVIQVSSPQLLRASSMVILHVKTVVDVINQLQRLILQYRACVM